MHPFLTTKKHQKTNAFYKVTLYFKRYTNPDLKICQYLCLHMNIIC